MLKDRQNHRLCRPSIHLFTNTQHMTMTHARTNTQPLSQTGSSKYTLQMHKKINYAHNQVRKSRKNIPLNHDVVAALCFCSVVLSMGLGQLADCLALSLSLSICLSTLLSVSNNHSMLRIGQSYLFFIPAVM